MAEIFFSDQKELDERPVIVLSKNHYNENEPDVVVCGVTSNSGHPLHLLINKNDLEAGNVLPESGARVDMLARLLKTQLKFRVGRITEDYHKRLLNSVVELIK